MPQPHSLTDQLVGFVLGQEKLPDAVLGESVRALVNWLGCALGGAEHEGTAAALAMSREFSGPATSTIIGHAIKLDAANAAFINCLASSLLSYDDTHLATITHPTGPVASVLLALSETQAITGLEFLEALAIGIEIECRLGNALIVPPAKAKLGWYVTGLTGGIAAALAGARALKLPHEQAMWAMGIAASQASGYRQTHGSMSIGLVPAHAARCALLAIRMAAHGFACSPNPLEARNGFFEVFSESANREALTSALGTHWEMQLNTYKPYPCGIVIHPAIDACLEIADVHDFDAAEIERIVARVSPACASLCDRPDPSNSYDAGVSLQHWIAASLLHRNAGIDELAPENIHSPAIASLRRKVRIESSEDVGRQSATVEVVLSDGRTLEREIVDCRGSISNPLTDQDLSRKFLAQSKVLPRASAEKLLAEAWRLGSSGNVAEFAHLAAR